MSPRLVSLLPERLRVPIERGGRPLRFAMAGTVNTVFGFAIYPLLRLVLPRLHYMATLGIAQALSLCFAYTSYRLIVFRNARGGSVLREIGTFSSFYVVSIAINWLALPAMVRLLHLPPAIAQTGFSFLLMVSSYFWHSRLTFRPAKAPR